MEVIYAEVTGIQIDSPEQYTVSAGGAEYSAPSVIIATGNKKLRPLIEGIAEFETKGVSYCAVCDGFFYRKKRVAVIGNGAFAFEEASHLSHIAESVTILTDGKNDAEIRTALADDARGENQNSDADAAPTKSAAGKIKIDTRKVANVFGNETGVKVGGVTFADGTTLALDGIFVALGSAGAADFAKKLGLALEGDSISVNEKMATNAPGIFSCGNATGGLLQVCKAVYEGGVAGLSAVEYVRGLKK